MGSDVGTALVGSHEEALLRLGCLPKMRIRRATHVLVANAGGIVAAISEESSDSAGQVFVNLDAHGI